MIGIVVRAPTATRANPAPLRVRPFSFVATRSPTPTPSATRVPASNMMSGTLNVISFMRVSPLRP